MPTQKQDNRMQALQLLQDPKYLLRGPGPWARYWARTIDSLLFGFVTVLLFALCIPSVFEQQKLLLTLYSIVPIILFEAIFISNWCTTPGKALLGIHLLRNGMRPGFRAAFYRTFMVWFKGLGFGIIPVVSILALLLSYHALVNKARMSWDREGNFTFYYKEFGTKLQE